MINHVILKNEGETVPMSFLKRALQPNPDGIGLAIAGSKELHIEAFTVNENSADELNQILNEAFKENFVMVQFTKSPDVKRKGVDNFGPFIAHKDDNFRLALGGTGLLPTWDEKNNLRTGLNELSKELLKPFIKGLAGSVEKSSLVNHPSLRGLLESQVDKYGCFVCMDNDGYYVFVQGRDLKHRDYSWGWSSRDLGTFDEEMKNNPRVEEQPEIKPPVVKVERPDDRQVSMELKPHRKLQRITPKKNAVANVLNHLISSQMKDAALENVVPLPNSDLIPNDQIEKVMNMSIKYIGGGGTVVPSMQTINKLIENTPDFEEQTGVTHTETLFYEDQALKDMQLQCPSAFFELHLALRRDLLLRMQEDFGGQHIPAAATISKKKVA